MAVVSPCSNMLGKASNGRLPYS